jgi:hypothetical protein
VSFETCVLEQLAEASRSCVKETKKNYHPVEASTFESDFFVISSKSHGFFFSFLILMQ